MEVVGTLPDTGASCVVEVGCDDTVSDVTTLLCSRLMDPRRAPHAARRMGLRLTGTHDLLPAAQQIAALPLEGGDGVEVVRVHPDVLSPCAYAVRHEVTHIALSPCGSFCASSDIAGCVTLWNTVTGKQVRSFTDDADAPFCLAVTFGGTKVVAANFNMTLCVWDTATGACEHLLSGHSSTVIGVAVAAAAPLLASVSMDASLMLWSLETGQALASVPSGVQLCVDIAEDGATVVSGGRDKAVRVWNADPLETVHRLEGHRGAVRAVRISECGLVAVSAADDTTSMVWGLRTGACLHTLRHSSAVRGVSLSPGGCAAVRCRGCVCLWDISTGEVRGTVEMPSDGEVCISPCGMFLFSVDRWHIGVRSVQTAAGG